MKRLFGLCLICLLVFIFVGCQKEEPKSQDTSSVVSITFDGDEFDDEPYQIVKEGVLLNPQSDGSLVMEVAHNTTVEEFFTMVVSTQGNEVAVVDQEGKKMETSQIITSGMTFEIFEKNNEEPVVSLVLQTVDASEIENAYKNIK